MTGSRTDSEVEAARRGAGVYAHIVETMVERPADAYDAIVRAVLELTPAGSSGISLYETCEAEPWVHWPAIAGLVSGQIAGSAPAAHLPCGRALSSGQPVEIDRPGELYPMIQALHPPVHGALCVPVRVDGRPAASLWAMLHDRSSAFEARDVATIKALANYVALHLSHLRSVAAREAAETSQRTLDALMECIPEGITIATAPAVKITHVSRYGQQLTGRPLEVLTNIPASRHPRAWQVRTTDRELVPSERLPLTRAAREGEIVRNEELKLRCADGSDRTILCNAGPIRNARGKVTGALMAWRDVDDLLRMQQALRESEERFRTLAELLPAKLFIADRNGLNTYANRQLYELTGAPDGGLAGSGWTRYVHPDDLPSVERAWATSVEKGEPYEVEYRFREARTGQYRWFLVRGNPIPDGTGEIAGWYGAAFDIDDARKAQAALSEAAKSKDAFLATLAHELRNPLAPIRNAARILESPRVDEGQADWCRKVIGRQVSIMARLLDDLLDLSRISQGRLELRPEPVQIWSLLCAAIETSRPLIDARRHELSVRMPEDPVRLTVDPVRITQVISNLLNNAARYTPEGGRIELEARIEPLAVIIEISDNGIGLATDEREKIFEMFTQVGDRRETDGGLGIGLALSRHLIELHRGRVEARSAGVGRGSTFIVSLPRQAADGKVPTASGCRAVQVVPRRVIVADDKQDVADSLALLLKLDGHDVRVAYSGLEALQLAQTFPADVAILDIGMQGMDGYALARNWKALDGLVHHPLLIALTGWGSSVDKQKAADAGFAHHLTKPVSPERLTELIRECR